MQGPGAMTAPRRSAQRRGLWEQLRPLRRSRACLVQGGTLVGLDHWEFSPADTVGGRAQRPSLPSPLTLPGPCSRGLGGGQGGSGRPGGTATVQPRTHSTSISRERLEPQVLGPHQTKQVRICILTRCPGARGHIQVQGSNLEII